MDKFLKVELQNISDELRSLAREVNNISSPKQCEMISIHITMIQARIEKLLHQI